MNRTPLSLYVHLPWCVRKCPYCDFNSHTAGDNAPRARYLQALKADVAEEATRADGRELSSIFLGGGTPSLFTPAEIGGLLENIDRHFELAGDIEVTMEANPGTVECGDPAAYRTAGVNRLSIGAQSFSARSLELLGRIHSVDDIARAVDEANAAGFESVNLDLMYGLPEQDVAAAMADIAAALALNTAHLSWYQLTLEPNTVFYARPPAQLPDEDLLHEIQEHGQALLSDGGLAQYEVSAWSTPGHQCRHNLNYWSFGDYLAVGAGAHGKYSDSTGIRRYNKPANPLNYMQAIESQQLAGTPAALDAEQLIFEFMLNALRLTDGFDESLFVAHTGRPATELRNATRTACERGLLHRNERAIWRPTALGRRFLDDLVAEFLPE